MSKSEFTAFFPFCGLGAGALGFLQAEVTLLGRTARFRSLGGIDCEEASCEDFQTLTRSPALQADVSTMTVGDLLEFCPKAPDCVFLSPPCKGFSGLLGSAQSKAPKYQKLNRLVLDWMELMLTAWADDLPGLVLLENVPRIASRGAPLLKKVRALLRAAGYVFHAQSHDCGELGGLAQHRRRYLLVARLPKRIVSEDGTWHRPLTTLELAALQGLPTIVDGRPLQLAGTSSTAWRERIGNAVPPPAARAIAEQMLIALVERTEGAMLLRGDGSVWVRREEARRG